MHIQIEINERMDQREKREIMEMKKITCLQVQRRQREMVQERAW